MKLTLLTAADYRRAPWKNGGGMTTEIMVEPRDAGARFDWRLSIADVARSGPFSDFSGYDRTIMLIEGAGFALDFDAAPSRRLDRPYEPFPFAGEWKAVCSLIDGPVRDFNLIAARNGPPASLTVERLASGSTAIAPAPTLVLHLLEGSATIGGRRLAPGDTLRVDGCVDGIWAVAAEPSVLAIVRVGAVTGG